MPQDTTDVRLTHLDAVLCKRFSLDICGLEQRLAITELAERQVKDCT